MNDIGMACGLAERLRRMYRERILKAVPFKVKYEDLVKATAREWEQWFRTSQSKSRKEVIEMGKCCGGKKGCKGGGRKGK